MPVSIHTHGVGSRGSRGSRGLTQTPNDFHPTHLVQAYIALNFNGKSVRSGRSTDVFFDELMGAVYPPTEMIIPDSKPRSRPAGSANADATAAMLAAQVRDVRRVWSLCVA